MAAQNIITRFGPSPTGFLHIGAIRTALFAYLFAKANHGQFILRIEDTDKARQVEGSVEDIQAQLDWLGINWDQGPLFQSQRLELYQQYANQLLIEGKAYYCFCSKERLDDLRSQQQKDKQMLGYDGHCRSIGLDEANKRIANGERAVVRFKIPDGGETSFNDAIRGEVVYQNAQLDDLIIVKADGYPTYHLAHVVDDHLMNVTHVHRGEEWIPSTPKHILMFEALGWPPPQYVHLPVILSQGGGKLSKRKGSVFVREFKEKGYLAEAMVNFMVLLGWGYDDKQEMFKMDELQKIFSHDHINKAAPVFSSEKLDWFNGVYIRQKSVADLADLCRPYLVDAGLIGPELSDNDQNYLKSIISLLQERVTVLNEVVEKARFFYLDEIEIEDPSLLVGKKSSPEQTVELLKAASQALEALDDFSAAGLESCLKDLAQQREVKIGMLFMPIRIAVSGTKESPGLFEMLQVLGKDRVLRRLEKATHLF